ncbi:MAG: hypothetical protein ABW298_07700 [Candidatus Binatia bacterium]
MSESRKSFGRSQKPGGVLDVLIALDREPDDAWLRELKDAVALHVRRIIGDKLVATIDQRHLEKLRTTPGVREVEVATTTRLH